MRKFLTLALMALLLATCAGCVEKGYKHLTQDEARELMHSNPNAIVLDVRKQDEYDKKHIPNALLVPVQELRNGNFDSLPDKDATLIVYCWTGRRAEEAAEILAANGYKNIYEMGGLVDWTGSITGKEIE